jgi:hypothetical protein
VEREKVEPKGKAMALVIVDIVAVFMLVRIWRCADRWSEAPDHARIEDSEAEATGCGKNQ